MIAVPVQGGDPFQMQQQMMTSKPPDYETAIGSKPPSYDEAIRISPGAFLPPPPLNTEAAVTNSSPIDCAR